MTRPFAAGLLLATLAAAANAQPAGEAFAPKDGKLSVRFPGKPKESNQTTKSPLGDLKVYTATYATAEGNVLLVSYTDFPGGAVRPDHLATLLDGVREGLKGRDGTVRSEKDVEIGPDKVRGRDIELDKGKQRVRFRVAFRDGRLFQAAAVGTPEFVTGKGAAAFIESFEMTK